MILKHYESTEVDRRTWLHVPSGTLWSRSLIFTVSFVLENVFVNYKIKFLNIIRELTCIQRGMLTYRLTYQPTA